MFNSDEVDNAHSDDDITTDEIPDRHMLLS